MSCGTQGIRLVPVDTSRLAARSFIARHADEMDRKITPKWIGGLIRRRLGLRTVRRSGSYLIAPSEAPKLEQLYEKYGLEPKEEEPTSALAI